MFIIDEPIPTASILAESASRSCGAQALFAGIVRNHDHGRAVQKLHYECYVPMAKREMGKIIEEAKARWAVDRITVLHRRGTLELGDTALLVVVHSEHRGEAFSACRYVVDETKRRAPIWKKQFYLDGTSNWVFCSREVCEEAVSK